MTRLLFLSLGSPYRDEITLGILQMQESNRLEILKRRWWEGGQCPKEEDHRAKVCQEMLTEFRNAVSCKKSSRSRRRRPLSGTGGGVLRHPSRLALATPRPIRLVREMRLSNGKLYSGAGSLTAGLGGGMGGGPDLGPGPQRLLEDPLSANATTSKPPPVSSLGAPPAPLRSFLQGCSHGKMSEFKRSQAPRSTHRHINSAGDHATRVPTLSVPHVVALLSPACRICTSSVRLVGHRRQVDIIRMILLLSSSYYY
ncbi:hypothetical protein FQN60_002193 [Etheostoma spectabile]|uniref:Ionotropic glutamate receptor C-terminal domain-containing protein n=1 Tax=Etheostoma spectabile TaxID=54343 RepID=A0A5J5DD66_9PERO|nr:hypothetical protein FQN60_002193 [Etheostoma spectabile]